MTINDVFEYTEKMYPCQYESDVKLMWVNQLEKEIADFLKLFGEVETYPHTVTTDEILIEEPDIYALYIGARADFANGEYARYNNKVAQFNAFMEEWQARYMRDHKPEGKVRYIKI